MSRTTPARVQFATAAVDQHLRDAGIEPHLEVIELRDHAQDLTNHLLENLTRRKAMEPIRVSKKRRSPVLQSLKLGSKYSLEDDQQDQFGEREAESLVGFGKGLGGDGEALGEFAAHANGLRTLPRK